MLGVMGVDVPTDDFIRELDPHKVSTAMKINAARRLHQLLCLGCSGESDHMFLRLIIMEE